MEQYYGLTAEMYRAVVALVDDRMKEVRLTRQDFDQVVEAQRRVEGHMERVEAALERLAQAQARTEERVGRLEEGQVAMQAAIQKLAQAQARTEERVGRLEEGQAALQKGQAAMQAAIQKLAQAQARTEERVGQLEEGQVAMQAAIQKLAQGQDRLSRDIGGLGEDIGFGLEDVARLLLPPYLHKHYGIRLEGEPGSELQRRFFPMKDRPADEIDLYGEGWRDGQHAIVLGESKARIGGGVVKDFADVLERVEPLVEGEVWRIMFGYWIHPSAQPVAEERRILLVASYQR